MARVRRKKYCVYDTKFNLIVIHGNKQECIDVVRVSIDRYRLMRTINLREIHVTLTDGEYVAPLEQVHVSLTPYNEEINYG